MKNIKKMLVFSLLILIFGFVGQPALAAAKINLNTATIAQLIEIKGIGEKTAASIVKYRENKKFSTVDELVNVKGIGEKTLAKIREQLTVAMAKEKKK